jgi:hypothetical protein
MDLLLRIQSLVTNGGWALLWFLATALAIWQILRGRSLAGLCIGAAAVFGIGRMVAAPLLSPLWGVIHEAVGYELTALIRSISFGTVDALVLLLLFVAAVLQRPPRVVDETG